MSATPPDAPQSRVYGVELYGTTGDRRLMGAPSAAGGGQATHGRPVGRGRSRPVLERPRWEIVGAAEQRPAVAG